jgi:hypothetical protein
MFCILITDSRFFFWLVADYFTPRLNLHQQRGLRLIYVNTNQWNCQLNYLDAFFSDFQICLVQIECDMIPSCLCPYSSFKRCPLTRLPFSFILCVVLVIGFHILSLKKEGLAVWPIRSQPQIRHMMSQPQNVDTAHCLIKSFISWSREWASYRLHSL